MRSLVAAMTLLLSGVLLGSCGTHKDLPAASSPAHQATAKTPSKAITTLSQAAAMPASPARCRASNIGITLANTEGAMGSTYRVYQMTNGGRSSCSLYGYPGMQLLDNNGQPLPTHVIREAPTSTKVALNDGQTITTSATEDAVTLPPGGKAWFIMHYANRTGYASDHCPTSSFLEVTPPNDFRHVTLVGLGGQLNAYGGTVQKLQCGTIFVQPVSAAH